MSKNRKTAASAAFLKVTLNNSSTLRYDKTDRGGQFLFPCSVENRKRYMIDSGIGFVMTGRFTSSYQWLKSLSKMLTRQQLLAGYSIPF